MTPMTAPTPQPVAVRHAAAAKMLGISARHLYTIRDREGIPHVRLNACGGQTVLYPVDELKSWLAGKLAEAAK